MKCPTYCPLSSFPLSSWTASPSPTVGQAELFGVGGNDATDATTVAQRHAAPEIPLMIARAGDDWAEQFGIESPTGSHGMNNNTGGAFGRRGTGDTHARDLQVALIAKAQQFC